MDYDGKQLAGFTIIELMVAITLMAILITLAAFSYSTAQKRGRDAQRKSDIRNVQSALEQYYAVCGNVYPTPSGDFYDPVVCGSAGPLTILPTIPADPRGQNPYACPTPVATNCTSSVYTVCATLEGESPAEYCLRSAQ